MKETAKGYLLTILKITVFFIGWAVLTGIIDVPSENPAVWRFFAELIPFLIILAFTIIFILLDHEHIQIPIAQNAGRGSLTGLLCGIVWIGISAGILLITHHLIVTGENKVSMMWLWIISALINVMMQELLVHGYIYQLLKTKYNLQSAVIVTTALFTLMHGGAFEAGILPVLNVITMSLFTTALYEEEGTLLAPVMAHAVWNIIGSLLLGGVSLADDYPKLLQMVPSGNTLISGGTYMIEGSVIVLIVNISLLVFFTLKALKNRSINTSAN
ncbi:MAG: CPBP family intramembrane glutamic endopeptidase [Lactimicrobium sp.]|jgi:membrane protease YdiL (CAAX protease family)|uniref:CPBP family intramembrane glutamic endopeptidase n=1 Tax=Lactimicrobium sp. TaxID=2563780 RepID=UPI002F359693